jgi:hypothetical protein
MLTPPDTPPDAGARRIIASIERYIADTSRAPAARAVGARHIALAARDLSDDAVARAHDEGVTWPQLGEALGLAPGSVNGPGRRAAERRARRETREAP